jgi:hypothetical protein
MVTAAQVLDPISSGIPMFVSGPPGASLIPMEGGVIRATMPPLGNRIRDHIDSAFWAMPNEVLSALGTARFVEPERISHSPPSWGYPARITCS